MQSVTSNAVAQALGVWLQRKAEQFSAKGWYKICEFGQRNYGQVIEVRLISVYNNTYNSGHSIKICCGFSRVSLVEVVADPLAVFSEFKVCQNDNNTTKFALFAYYNTTTSNAIRAHLIGQGEGRDQALNLEQGDPSVYYSVYTFASGRSGLYVNGTKLA